MRKRIKWRKSYFISENLKQSPWIWFSKLLPNISILFTRHWLIGKRVQTKIGVLKQACNRQICVWFWIYKKFETTNFTQSWILHFCVQFKLHSGLNCLKSDVTLKVHTKYFYLKNDLQFFALLLIMRWSVLVIKGFLWKSGTGWAKGTIWVQLALLSGHLWDPNSYHEGSQMQLFGNFQV